MSFGQSPTTTTEGALPSNQIFISSVATPNTANGDLTALEGGPISTDSNSNKTAPASMYVKDGNDVTEGAKADTAITDSTTTNTKMSFLKGVVKILADIWDSVNHRIKVDGSGVTQPVSGTFWQATQPVSGTVTANQGGSWTVAANSYDHTQPGFKFVPVDNVSITAGSPVAGWTPTTGKKFRLMGIYLNLSNGISGTAIILKDASTEFFRISRDQTNNVGTSHINLAPNGYLSASVNNVLNIDVVGNSSSIVEGTLWGFEE